MIYQKMPKGVRKFLKETKEIIQFGCYCIFVLFLCIAIGLISTVISGTFNVPIQTVSEKIVGIIIILIAFYTFFMMRHFFKEIKNPTVLGTLLSYLFKWIGPICEVWIGICIVLN